MKIVIENSENPQSVTVLKPYQKQALAHRRNVKKQLDGLKCFIAESEVFVRLDDVEQEQLRTQAELMQSLENVLCRRIARFDLPNAQGMARRPSNGGQPEPLPIQNHE